MKKPLFSGENPLEKLQEAIDTVLDSLPETFSAELKIILSDKLDQQVVSVFEKTRGGDHMIFFPDVQFLHQLHFSGTDELNLIDLQLCETKNAIHDLILLILAYRFMILSQASENNDLHNFRDVLRDVVLHSMLRQAYVMDYSYNPAILDLLLPDTLASYEVFCEKVDSEKFVIDKDRLVAHLIDVLPEGSMNKDILAGPSEDEDLIHRVVQDPDLFLAVFDVLTDDSNYFDSMEELYA